MRNSDARSAIPEVRREFLDGVDARVGLSSAARVLDLPQGLQAESCGSDDRRQILVGGRLELADGLSEIHGARDYAFA